MSDETKLLTKYSNFSDLFSSDSVAELLEHTRIKDHSINMLDNKQLLYSLIYGLKLVELEKLKTYIKANIASNFIRLSKLLTNTLILFI